MSHRRLSALSLAFAVCFALFTVGDAFANPARVAASTVRAAAGKSLPARTHAYGMPTQGLAHSSASVRLSEREAERILGKKSETTLSQEALVKMCEGDPAAAKAVSDVAYAQARFHVKRYDLRDDVVQQALFKLFTYCSELIASPPASPTTYISRAVERTWIDMLRANGRYDSILGEYESELLADYMHSASCSMRSTINRARARQALEFMMKHKTLTDRQSEVLLESVMGSTHEEIANDKGISRARVSQILVEVRARAQEAFCE